ncbi:MAG: T9SS type A sorting domain-containing protein, partial [Ignavibacteriaceae bacterium]
YIFAEKRFNPFTLGITPLTDVNIEEPIKLNYKLEQNFPNPFNPGTKIRYIIQASPNPSQRGALGNLVQLKVYDVLGNEVATLVNEYKDAGTYQVEFSSSNINHHTSSGVYFYQLKVADYIETKKMIFMK